MQWLILNFTGPGSWIGPTVLKQLLGGPTTDLNMIFPITWVSAVISFFIILMLLFKRTSKLNSLMVASACPFGADFLFGFILSIIALIIHGHPILQGNPYYIIQGISWLIMPISGIGFWLRNRILDVSIIVFIIGFVVWVMIEFPILSGFSSILLNYITKIASFSIITSLFIERTCLKKK
jgi:hypothetical protein